jgi:hypothetical protein
VLNRIKCENSVKIKKPINSKTLESIGFISDLDWIQTSNLLSRIQVVILYISYWFVQLQLAPKCTLFVPINYKFLIINIC